jgi:hypothetical protein
VAGGREDLYLVANKLDRGEVDSVDRGAGHHPHGDHDAKIVALRGRRAPRGPRRGTGTSRRRWPVRNRPGS